MNDDELRAQINELIRDEIQQGINEYLDQQETEEDKPELGFANPQEESNELKVNIPKDEVDRLLKEYKRIKKNEKSNFAQIKKLGLVDKDGNPL